MKRENNYETNYETIVIGAGAGGLFFGAACSVSAPGNTLILEKTNKIGTKLLMSGSGQCNLTHSGSIKEFLSCYGQNGNRIRTVLYKHNNMEMQSFMHGLGIETIEREDGKIFPLSLSAKEVRDALLGKCKENGIEIRCDAEVIEITPLPGSGGFAVSTSAGLVYSCRNLVIAAGGSSYPTTGSDGSLLHTIRRSFPELGIREPKPSLVPVFVENYPFEALSGISFRNVEIKIFEPKSAKPLKLSHPCGDLLLTHKNLSGPVILNNSRDIFAGCRLEINFVFPYTVDNMISQIKEDFSANRRMISTYIGEKYLLPKKFVSAVLDRINVCDKAIASLTGSEINRIAEAFAKASFSISGTAGFGTAMATAGGISLEDVNLSEMQSKKYPGLYFIGEVLDVDGDTGGYNLQFAYSSAMTALAAIYQKNNIQNRSTL